MGRFLEMFYLAVRTAVCRVEDQRGKLPFKGQGETFPLYAASLVFTVVGWFKFLKDRFD